MRKFKYRIDLEKKLSFYNWNVEDFELCTVYKSNSHIFTVHSHFMKCEFTIKYRSF